MATRMSKVAEIINSASYLSEVRKMLFATAQLPTDMPNYWEVIAQFASSTRLQFSKGDVQLLMQNLRCLNEAAFVSDKSLLKELYNTPTTAKKEPMGIVLLSPNCTCLTCGASLCIRKDRPSRVIVYTDSDGIHYQPHTTENIVRNTDLVDNVVLSNIITSILKVSVLTISILKYRPDFLCVQNDVKSSWIF
jgi:hypothetical protein